MPEAELESGWVVISKQDVVNGVSAKIVWWLAERKKKLREQLDETMSVNPFMMPVLYDFHDLDGIESLNNLLIGGHLLTGHATGFGKLMDEKVLPDVFKTQKLDSAFRKKNKPYQQSCFDEVDHLVYRPKGNIDLLSLKASRWTIQLTMAVQLNAAFDEIVRKFPGMFRDIAVGVFYGKKEKLTDKYDIVRGINRGKNHDVTDLTSHVHVYAGREFWTWLNEGEAATQDWVLEGIQAGVKKDNCRAESRKLLKQFQDATVKAYAPYRTTDGGIDWAAVLKGING